METGTTDFELRVELVRALASPQWDQFSMVEGQIAFNESLYDGFIKLLQLGEAEWLGDGAKPTPYGSGKVKLKFQQGVSDGVQKGYVLPNLDALLRFGKARLEIVEPIYLADANWVSGTPNEPEAYTKYRKAIQFTQWLKNRSDVSDSERLIFLLSEKLELPLAYSEVDVISGNYEGLEVLEELLAPDLHKDQRKAIAVKALIEMLSGLALKERFAFLLRSILDYLERVRSGYALYASEFSYEKVRNEVESFKLDLAARLNKTIGEIQNQVLAIPVATILVATQMKSGPGNLSVNFSLAVASGIFVFLMRLIIKNQKDSLSVLGEEIDRQSLALKKDYKGLADQFSQVFESLRNRKQTQETRLKKVWFAVVGGFLFNLAVAVFLAVEPVAPPKPPVAIPANQQPSDSPMHNAANKTSPAPDDSKQKTVGK